jgi:hypothetical protein
VGSSKLTILVVDDPFEVSFIEDFFVFGDAEQESAATDIVDLAGDPLGVVVETGDKTLAEDLILRAGHTQLMFDVGDGLLKVKGTEMVTDGDPLMEGLVGGEAKELGQIGLTEQDQGEQGGGVHLVVEEKAELVEDVGGQAMGFIDNEQEIASLASQIGQGGAKLRQEAVEGVGRFDLEGQEDLAVEGGDLEMRVGQVSDRKQVTV